MSSEAVTADELAEALKKILKNNSIDVLWTRTLLASYDAQQSNPSPVLVPTHNCSMADTGDFDECCIVCGESTDGGHPPERCVKNIESATFQAIEFEQGFLKARKESINPSLAEELLRTKDELAKVVKAYDSAMVRLSEEVSRRTALNREDRIPGPSKRALSEVEKAAVNVVNAHDVVVRLSHRTVRGIEASVECDKTIEALRDALKRIGAL